MRKINHFYKKGGELVSITDSMSRLKSCATWGGSAKKFWVKAKYDEAYELPGVMYPSLDDAEEVWLIEEGDETPEPREGWCYAFGFFG